MRLPGMQNMTIEDFTVFDVRLLGWCQDDGVSPLKGQDDTRMMSPPRNFCHACHSRDRMLPGWPHKQKLRPQILATSIIWWKHKQMESSARGQLEVTWLKKTRLEVTWRPCGSRKLGSKSLLGHLARANSSRRHFEVTWLGNGSKPLDSSSPGSRKLFEETIRTNCSRELSWLHWALHHYPLLHLKREWTFSGSH